MTDWIRESAGPQTLMLQRNPGAVREAREFIGRLLKKRRAPRESVETAQLVSSELVTNAIEHGKGEIELRVSLLDDRVRVEVIDEGRDQAPAVRQQRDDEIGGWGLQIVDQLALQWGVFEGTTHVWADLTLV
jgi:anti-sigma regulatory factor (Ser/Thr protein kinase)